jgi:hypothetical protein
LTVSLGSLHIFLSAMHWYVRLHWLDRLHPDQHVGRSRWIQRVRPCLTWVAPPSTRRKRLSCLT